MMSVPAVLQCLAFRPHQLEVHASARAVLHASVAHLQRCTAAPRQLPRRPPRRCPSMRPRWPGRGYSGPRSAWQRACEMWWSAAMPGHPPECCCCSSSLQPCFPRQVGFRGWPLPAAVLPRTFGLHLPLARRSCTDALAPALAARLLADAPCGPAFQDPNLLPCTGCVQTSGTRCSHPPAS